MFGRFTYDPVPAARARELFADVLGEDIAPLGFEPRRDLRLVRECGDGVFNLVEPYAFRGETYVVRWGVSLPFLPHRVIPKVRRHRTRAAARFDLFCVIAPDLHWPSAEQVMERGIPALDGEKVFLRSLRRVWRQTRKGAIAWLRASETLDGIAQLAAEQREFSMHNPDPLLVHAFVLHALGRREQAHESFREAVARGTVDSAEVDAYRALLA